MSYMMRLYIIWDFEDVLEAQAADMVSYINVGTYSTQNAAQEYLSIDCPTLFK